MPTTINGTTGVNLIQDGTIVAADFASSTGTGATVLATSPTITTPTIATPTITGAVLSSMGSSVITAGTAQSSASGTAITFTGIPSWVKKVTMILSGVSLTGSDNFLVQIGSGSLTTSGYSNVTGYAGASTGSITSSSGILIVSGGNAGDATWGQISFYSIGSNTWVASGGTTSGTAINYFSVPGGAVSLSGALDRISITRSISDSFDAGTINIFYQ